MVMPMASAADTMVSVWSSSATMVLSTAWRPGSVSDTPSRRCWSNGAGIALASVTLRRISSYNCWASSSSSAAIRFRTPGPFTVP